MKVKDAIVEYEIAVLRLASETRRWYSSKLAVFNEYCEEQNLELESIKINHIRLFLEWLKKRKNRHTGKPISTYTIHGYAAVVKRFLSWCSKEEDFDKLVPERLPGKIVMPVIDEKLIEVYSDAQVKAMIDACSKVYEKRDTMNRKTSGEELAIRDRAIVCLLADTGIRVGELCSLSVENCFLYKEDAFLKIYGSKGHKWREVPLGIQSVAALRRYITRWRRPRDKKEQRVFIARSGGPVDTSTVDRIIKRLGQYAGIVNIRVSAHTFRHYYAVSFLKAGGGVARLSRLLGHSSLGTTERYISQFQSREARQNGISVLDKLQERSK